jgi:UDP-N-acetylglucosamine--N-acetylmuramyl-(pentapeptide) pyrophosphoryl-undecaprenol N-acetylglucosamine transferase
MAPGLRLAVAGGGTGGHIVPGLHLLDHLVREGGLEDLLWFHSGRAVEEHVMRGLAAHAGGAPLETVALPLEPEGGGAPSLALTARRLLPTARRARAALGVHGSGVLLGLGGFTSAPAVLAARSRGVPAALIEINAAPGKATRMLAPLCRQVFHAWPETVPTRPGARHVLVGPPLSPAFGPVDDEPRARAAARARLDFTQDAPLVVVLGGSQGARGLNEFCAHHDDVLAAAGVQVLHQVGPGRLDEAAPARPGYAAREYLDDVPGALRAADLVLCRGGASTLAEVGALGAPAWVVPYPHHADRHQERNARQLRGGVRLVPQESLDRTFARELAAFAGPEGHFERARMRQALADAVPGDAAARILDALRAMSR